MNSLASREVKSLLRQDLFSFIEGSFYELNPQTEFLPNWHIEVIASELERCRRGETRRLIINVPPRSLKSHCATVAFVAWLLGHNPSEQIICASYGQDLANKHASDCRALILSDFYQQLFPTRLSRQRQAVNEFMTTKQGLRMATSVGGVLTGRGANFVIIDDPHKPEEALSETLRKAANNWFDHTLYSRLNDKRTGCIILIMQRLHENDLVGHVLEKDANWRIVRFPAIAEEKETHRVETLLGTQEFVRLPGDALHPEREPIETLEHIRATLGEYNFAGQYQQAPAPFGGGMVRELWLRRYALTERPAEFEMVVQSWDTANKPSELADYSVCTTWGVKNKHFYLLHVFRKRLAYPDLKRAVRELAVLFRPRTILIEDKASGTQLIQELTSEGLYAVKAYTSSMDKITRLNTVTAMIESGFVHVPDREVWLPEYLHELTTFPAAKYDDQTDSTSQALDWLKQQQLNQTPGLIEFWKMQIAEDQDRAAGRKPPTCCPQCQATCIGRIGFGWRCGACGHQFGHQQMIQRGPTSRDILNSTWPRGW